MIHSSKIFIEKIEQIIAENLNNEQFGVKVLADKMGMSRSNLHRKLHKETGKNISQHIREFRLKEAHRLLQESDRNASEVAHAVGFGSLSYFSKSFSEHFGYSPSKARFKQVKELENVSDKKSNIIPHWLWPTVVTLTLVIGFVIFSNQAKEVVAVDNNLFTKKSIIVLPFKNLSSVEENQYLADGIVEAISRNLSGIESIEVINTEASGSLTSLKEIRETLNVSSVLKGSVQKQDSMIRVEVKLLDTSNESQIWAENYDRKSHDILKINNDIARNVARTLQVTLTSGEKSLIEKQNSYHPIAYDYVMQGIYQLEQFTPEGQANALSLFNRALDIDSTLAPAYHGLAGIHLIKISAFGLEAKPEEALEKARYFIKKARQYDPTIWETYGQEAYINSHVDWNFEKAEELFLLCMDKSMPIYHGMYIYFLLQENRYQEAYEQYLEFNKKNPFYHNAIVLSVSFYMGDYEWGNNFIESRANTNTISLFNLRAFGGFYLNYGEYEKAISWLKKQEELYGVRLPGTLGDLSVAYAKKGDTQQALALLDELKHLKTVTDVGSPAWYVANIYSALGEKKEALKWLEIAVDDHEHEVVWLVSEPQLYSLHGHPRFDALVKKIGFREHAYPIENIPSKQLLSK